MNKIVYEIVEHDRGWASKVDDVFSETFDSHEAALEAAEAASQRQKLPGASEPILYQEEVGAWRSETAEGSDRPETEVADSSPYEEK